MNMIKTIDILHTKTHAIFFTREFAEDWGYMGMRDYKTYEGTDIYGVDVVPFNKYSGRADNSDAGLIARSFSANGFDRETANRIWWNVKKRGVGYETLREALREYITREA